MEDTSEAGSVDSHKEMEKQRAIKVILRYDRDRPRVLSLFPSRHA